MTGIKFYDPGLDIVRGIACLLVLVHHFASRFMSANPDSAMAQAAGFLPVRMFADGGGFGVLYFYVLSSFLLSKLLLLEYRSTGNISLYAFWMRRCYRIWPLYFAYLALLLVLAIIGLDLPMFPGGAKTFSLFVFLFNWCASGCLACILWSVCVEEQFYVLLMLTVHFAGVKRFPLAALVFIVLGIMSRLVVATFGLRYPSMWYFTTSHLDAFGLGMLAAWMMPHQGLKIPTLLRVGLIAAGLIWPALAGEIFGPGYYDGYRAVASYFFTSLFALGLIVGLGNPLTPAEKQVAYDQNTTPTAAERRLVFFAWSLQVRKLLDRALIYVGRRAYGIYVFHWLALSLMPRLLHFSKPDEFTSVDLIAASIVTLLLAHGSFVLIESPFVVWKRRHQVVNTTPLPNGAAMQNRLDYSLDNKAA